MLIEITMNEEDPYAAYAPATIGSSDNDNSGKVRLTIWWVKRCPTVGVTDTNLALGNGCERQSRCEELVLEDIREIRPLVKRLLEEAFLRVQR